MAKWGKEDSRIVRIAKHRTGDFLRSWAAAHTDIEVLVVSAYVQGLKDMADALARKEADRG